MAHSDETREAGTALARCMEEIRWRSQAMVDAQRFGPPAPRSLGTVPESLSSDVAPRTAAAPDEGTHLEA